MNARPARLFLAIAGACGALSIGAQQPSAPNFAPSNVSPKGIEAIAANCAMCHGTNGRAAPGSVVPGLAGRAKEDTMQSMAQFKSGQKPATLMHQISKGYSDAEIAAVAEYFSRQPR